MTLLLLAFALSGLTRTSANSGNCYRRKNVVLANCATGTTWQTYTLSLDRKTWTQHANTNCFKGHGASTVFPEPFGTKL